MPWQSEDNDEEWVALNYNIGGKTNQVSKDNTDTNTDDEDWDKEIEDWEQEHKPSNEYNSVVDACHVIENAESPILDSFQNLMTKYPPAAQAFSQTAHYDSFVYKKLERKRYGQPTAIKRTERNLVSQHCVIGQFDDMEE